MVTVVEPAQLETAPTKHGGESVYLFLEFTIIQVAVYGVYWFIRMKVGLEARPTGP